MTTFNTDELSKLVNLARQNSPYFRKLYESLPQPAPGAAYELEDLPLVSAEDYWAAARADRRSVLTGPLVDAVPMRSGGSTDDPKTSHIARADLRRVGRDNAADWVRAGHLRAGDRVANLMSFGAMYGGWQLVCATLDAAPVPLVHLCIGNTGALDRAAAELEDYGATVVVAVVFYISQFATHLAAAGRTLPRVRRLLYTGERFPAAMAPRWRAAFPNARIAPAVYGSVETAGVAFPVDTSSSLSRGGGGDEDAGEGGAEGGAQDDDDDAADPLLTAARENTVVELIGEDGRVIREAGVRGAVHTTQLLQTLQPLIRYQLGDAAEWVDYGARTLRLRGREGVAVKIASALLEVAALKRLVTAALGVPDVTGAFQAVSRMAGEAASLVLRVALPEPPDSGEVAKKLDDQLAEMSPPWRTGRERGYLLPVSLEWVTVADLVVTEKSGKLSEIVDERNT